MSAEKFYKEYFNNSAMRLIHKVEELAKEDRPF